MWKRFHVGMWKCSVWPRIHVKSTIHCSVHVFKWTWKAKKGIKIIWCISISMETRAMHNLYGGPHSLFLELGKCTICHNYVLRCRENDRRQRWWSLSHLAAKAAIITELWYCILPKLGTGETWFLGWHQGSTQGPGFACPTLDCRLDR